MAARPTDELLGTSRWAGLCLVVIVVAAVFVGNASTTLWDQDEAAYAGFARKMLRTGNWVVPDFPYSQPHRKPPLQFWAMAASYAVFGVNEFAARVPSALALLGAAGCLAWGTRWLTGRDAGRLAAIILATSVFPLTIAKIALTDSLLMFFQTVAALAMLRGMTTPNWRSTTLLWVAVAGGLLVKGPPIIILVGTMFVVLLILHPRRWNLVHLHPWFGLPLACVPFAVWLGAAWQADQRFVLFLAYWYVVRRVGGSVYGQIGIPGTYFVLMFACLAPWTPAFLPALGDVWKGLRRRRHFAVCMIAWLAGAWLVWEIPLSKLPTYALGAYPALALLIGRWLVRRGGAPWGTRPIVRLGLRIQLAVAIGIGAAVLAMAWMLGGPWIKCLGAAPGLILVIAVWQAMRHAPTSTARSVRWLFSGAMIAHGLVWLVVVPGIEPLRGATARIAHTIAERARAGSTVLVACPVLSPSLPFYVLQRGLNYADALDATRERPPPDVDWSILWRDGVGGLKRSLDAQQPRKLTSAEEAALRLEQCRAAIASHDAVVLVLSEAQRDALGDALAGAQITDVPALVLSKFQRTRYVIAVLPGALPVPRVNPNANLDRATPAAPANATGSRAPTGPRP